MKFTFLGTAASEQYPAIFCSCEYCQKARERGGRNVRVCSSAYLEPDCLIDCNPGTVTRAQEFGVFLPAIERLLVTHSHADHFAPGVIRCRRMNAGVKLPVTPEDRKTVMGVRFCELPMLHVYGTEAVCQGLRENGQDPDPEVLRIQLHRVDCFETFEAGDMRCVALKADHNQGKGVSATPGLNYIIQRGGKTILYALDTGWFPDETLQKICEFQYDLVVMDATFGLGREDPKAHMNLPLVEKALHLFRERRLLKEGTPFCATHICPHWTPIHDEIAPIMAAKGITVAYDGLSINL